MNDMDNSKFDILYIKEQLSIKKHIVITGPIGSGKSTLLKELRLNRPGQGGYKVDLRCKEGQGFRNHHCQHQLFLHRRSQGNPQGRLYSCKGSRSRNPRDPLYRETFRQGS